MTVIVKSASWGQAFTVKFPYSLCYGCGDEIIVGDQARYVRYNSGDRKLMCWQCDDSPSEYPEYDGLNYPPGT